MLFNWKQSWEKAKSQYENGKITQVGIKKF